MEEIILKHKHRKQDNIKMDLKEIRYETWSGLK
jgi:hypothetical protein